MRLAVVAPFALLLLSKGAAAATHIVSPTSGNPTLASILPKLQPGDIVEVEGGVTYPADTHMTTSGVPGRPITFRGMQKNGKLPVISGGDYGMMLHGNNLVFENFEVKEAKGAGVLMKGNNVVVRHVVVHDCQNHGILGTDEETGNLIIEYSELYKNGSGDRHHQIYVATDEEKFKGSVFRMQFNYLHDAKGGVSVKSRAERTEILYNWIEGAQYQELDLIGAEEHDENVAREDADVVGNVFRRTSGGAIARLGGDGSGQSNARYRFLNNTMIMHTDGSFVFRAQDGIGSIELQNNVMYREKGPAFGLVREEDADWVGKTSNIYGSHNWVNAGVRMPAGVKDTIFGSDPGFTNAGAFNYTPKCEGALVNAGTDSPTSPAAFPFPKPTPNPTMSPARAWLASGAGPARAKAGVIDVGAFECVAPASMGPAPKSGGPFGLDGNVLHGIGKKKIAAGALLGGGLLFAVVRRARKRAPTA